MTPYEYGQRYDRIFRHRGGYHHFSIQHDKERWIEVWRCGVCGRSYDATWLTSSGCVGYGFSVPEVQAWHLKLFAAHAHVPFSLKAIRVAVAIFAVTALPLVVFFGLLDGIPPGRMIRRFREAATRLEGGRPDGE